MFRLLGEQLRLYRPHRPGQSLHNRSRQSVQLRAHWNVEPSWNVRVETVCGSLLFHAPEDDSQETNTVSTLAF